MLALLYKMGMSAEKRCKAPEMLDTVLHKFHAASATGACAARTWLGVA